MRLFTYSIFLLSMALCVSSWMCPKKKKEKQKFQITGSIMETRSYCGGAVPSAELLAQCNTPMGVAYGKLYVKKGNSNKEKSAVMDSIVADKSGKFIINLPAGTYCLVEDWKSQKFTLPDNTEIQTVDSTCYRNRYNTCDYQLTVADKNIDSVKVVFHRNCAWSQPCINYHGPLPPAAQPNHQIKGKVGE
jgi:hypothetical protein